jgi:SPP1 family predicted phage head-tail adaptor
MIKIQQHAGQLREQVTFRQRTDAKNAAGGRSTQWADRCTVYAQVISLDGREAVLGSVLTGISHFQIVIRFRTDIQPSDQAVWNGKELNVISVGDRDNTRQWLYVIATTEGATQDA